MGVFEYSSSNEHIIMNVQILVFVALFSFNFYSTEAKDDRGPSHREGKLFSLFNIVTFKNDGCRSTSTTSGGNGNRNGTCFTAIECQDKGGSSSGSCTATLNFAFSGAASTRAWEVKATQIPCASRSAPDEGCLQYNTGLTGRI